MSDQQIIVIKKSDEHDDHGHHGGGWKVAYADFMTAMMAFFLLMWIISTSDEEKLEGLAEYFTPADMSDVLGGKGVLDGQVFGPDGVYSGIDGDSFQLEPPSFGQDEPISPPDDRGDDIRQAELLGSEGEEDGQFNEAATADQEQSALRAEKLDGVAKEIESAVAVNAALVELVFNLRVDTTPDGLLVQILDQEERPMFALGSARIDGAIQDLLNIIGMSVADLPYPLVITGHTDAVPFATRANYGNWELSADRANAARRALVSTGVAPERIARVSGVADTVPRNTEVPTAAENRRLTILLHYPEVAGLREMPAEIEGFAGNIPQR